MIWCYLNQFDGDKGCVEKIRSEWKRFCGDDFHETMMYFWIHMVRYWRVMFREYLVKENKNQNKVQWTFMSFVAFCEGNKNDCQIVDEQRWTLYYSESAMYHGGFHNLDASQQMVFPDRKPLPQLRLMRVHSK